MAKTVEMEAGGLEFDTDALPPEKRFATWASAMPFYDVRTPDPVAFRATIRAWLLPPVIIVDAWLSEISVSRRAAQIHADAREDIVLQLLLEGSFSGAAAGREICASPGEIVVHDRASWFDGTFTAGRSITVSFPRSFLEERLPAASVHGLVLRDGLALPLAAFLGSLVDILGREEGGSGELARLLRDLIAAALRRAGPVADQPPEATLAARARRYIRQNLSRRLDVQSLCEALGVSRSRLYRAFEQEGGVGRYVTHERLKQVYRLLADPGERAPIGELAAAHGFSDSAHFSRLFRRTFGYPPQALRRGIHEESKAAQGVAISEDAPPARFNRWEAGRS